jgi:hypothetical protein
LAVSLIKKKFSTHDFLPKILYKLLVHS